MKIQHLVILLVIVIVIFGPSSLPKLARIIGSWIRDFHDIKEQLPSKDDFALDQKEKQVRKSADSESQGAVRSSDTADSRRNG